MFVYLGVFAAYIVFSLRFKNMQRHWYSPLGLTGAVVGIGLDMVLMVSTMGYTFEGTSYVTVYFVYVALCVLYYFLYAQYHQFYSPEEQQKFLKAYITTLNKRKRTSKSTFSVTMVAGDMIVGGGSRYSAKSRETSTVGRLERSLTPNRVIPVELESIDRTGMDLPHMEEMNDRRNQATFVYIGMFTSFIVFRTNFSGMKRHWVSPVGIPGALVGLGMALILCIAVVILDSRSNAVITYFVFMGCAMLYYVLYARHTQYFSKEEQKHFLKAYIVNANNAKTKTKQKTAQQKAMAMFAPISQMFGLPTAAFSRSNGGASSASMAPSGRTSSHAPVASISKHNTVAPAPASLGVEIVESPSKVDAEVRVQEPSRSTEAESLATSTTVRSARPQNVPLRASWAAGAGSTKVSWSGKAMTMTESKKFLEVLMSAPEDVTDQLVESLPNQFVSLGVDEAATSARLTVEEDGGLEEEREVFLDDADTNEPVA
eukprot:gene2324-biopygen1010